ncbi:unnamed protein product [Dibothriocephalus latus]|uniref:Uncharacterized protein n=1 Tax=Dibothriocephalus latus TaxID=60516 RepID=A0A3P7MCL0_DIBLA|nr:unnamed protein product [Dibothriocephalus latus]
MAEFYKQERADFARLSKILFPDAKVVSNVASPDVLDAAIQEGDDETPTIYLISNLNPEPELPPELKTFAHRFPPP